MLAPAFAAPAPASLAIPGSAIHGVLVTGAGSLGLITLVSALYVVKSALGINLMNGPSPLHDLLFPLVHYLR